MRPAVRNSICDKGSDYCGRWSTRIKIEFQTYHYSRLHCFLALAVEEMDKK